MGLNNQVTLSHYQLIYLLGNLSTCITFFRDYNSILHYNNTNEQNYIQLKLTMKLNLTKLLSKCLQNSQIVISFYGWNTNAVQDKSACI